MSKVVSAMSMSLDGFVTGPNDRPGVGLGEGGERLHEWIFAGSAVGAGPREGPADPTDARVLRGLFEALGAVVMGRRSYEIGREPWGEDPPFRVPCFVLTHHPEETIVKGETSYIFVTGGIEEVIERARQAAGAKVVHLHGATVPQQCLRAGLLDEILIHLVPVLLGEGRRLFEHLGTDHIELERIGVTQGPEVTHLGFRVLR